MARIHNIEFPKGKILLGNDGKAYLKYNESYVNKFNNNFNRTQMYLDETVAKELSGYVSFKSGMQSLSIPLSTDYGSGIVSISVPYARFQAYGKVMVGEQSGSAWAKKGEKKIVTTRDLKYHSNSKRGKFPFERMKADKKDSILRQVSAYARRLNNG
ncbi:MAG: hypothetical protein IKO78_02690 [Bacilli bacterium]|nr:hypothetical protein [Bacilli bacterium]